MVMRRCIKQIIITFVLAFFSTGYAATADAFGLAVSASSDASVYGRGQTVFISTVAQYADGNPLAKIKKAQIRIKNSRREEVRRADLTTIDADSFSYEYLLPQEARTGIWEFQVIIADELGNKGNAKIKVEVNESGIPSGDPAGLDLKVVTNDSAYAFGQTISIKAQALNALGESLGALRKSQVRIKDGEKEEVFKGSLINYGNDSFGYDYVIPSSSEDGEWEVKVSFVDQKRNKGNIRIKIKVNDNSSSYFDMDGDGFNTAVDCNDLNASINPGATDTACDGIDQDCSGSDTVDASCTDNDADGYTADVDCNDSDSTINPGATDTACDGVDQDCSGSDAVDASCTDNDADGYTADVDCNDSNSNINPDAVEVCEDDIDQNCDGVDDVCPPPACEDIDGDGYDDAACGGPDCNDNDDSIFPGAIEVCGDGIDQNCDNTDIPCGTGHDSITQYLGPQTCIACHEIEAQDMLESLHMTWSGPTTELTNTSGEEKGKAVDGINTFCTYAMSSKGACFSCHVRADGNAPHAPDVNDVDCLMCHNDTYQRKFVSDLDNPVTVTNILNETRDYYFGLQDAEGNYETVPDYDKMPANITMVDIAQNVHLPTRASCLRCHAKAGGGDWTKRGDMGLSTKAPTVTEDVHMSPDAGGADLTCTACHASAAHKIGGRGIDLRQTEAPDPKCTDCHSARPHSDSTLNRHASGQVACQVCHIREFGKGGATEMSRDWYQPVWNPAFCAGQGGFVGHEVKVANVKPDYRWFDGTSYVYNLGETIQPNADGTYTMAKANGEIFDGKSKIVPIKDHWSVMPLHESGQMIPPVIMEMFMTGDFDKAVQLGMSEQGMSGNYSIVDANTEMLITHGVEPKSMAPTCNDCHDYSGKTPDGAGMVPFTKLGYHTWPEKVKNCTLCHEQKNGSWKWVHSYYKHQSGGEYNIQCNYCHTNEPTGFVKTTSDLCNDCHGYESPSGFNSDDHKKHIQKGYECAACHTF